MYRALLIAACLIAGLPAGGSRAPAPHEMQGAQVATAVKAAVAAPQRREIVDHYGDPDSFIQYIVRKPPTFV